jgi:hypothetical protein
MTTLQLTTFNYTVPANRNPQIYFVTLDLIAGIPQFIDFHLLSLDGAPFYPQGFYYDNLGHADDVQVSITGLPLIFSCFGNDCRAHHIPAVADQKIAVMTPAVNGRIKLAFADFPVLPFH